MTAGELLRAELAQGASQLGLAKRLAGSQNDADAEVKRWRYVVQRAARGSEPQGDNVKRIEETFGVSLDRPERQSVRQAELEASVIDLTKQVQRLARRVAAAERLARAGAERGEAAR